MAAGQILTFPSPKVSAEKIVHWMEAAAADGVDVVAFPEAAVCGYAAVPEEVIALERGAPRMTCRLAWRTS